MRIPRHDSDTTRFAHARFEMMLTLRAAREGIAPDVFHAYYSKHATRESRKGLHAVCQRYPFDLYKVMLEQPEAVLLAHRSAIGRRIEAHLARLAKLGISCST